MDPTEDILDDILFKFVLNLGPDVLGDKVQLMFQIERAWWYYEDSVRKDKPNLRHYGSYGTFTNMLVEKVPMIQGLLGDAQVALKEYAAFKQRIPVYGAILMDKNMERVLLVRGHASTAGWGFPRGKINHGEAEHDCACREVLEETGYNIEALIQPGEFIQCKGQNDKLHKLFIVVGLDPDTCTFAPQMAGEVGAYGWHWLHELPVTREDADKAYIASGGKQHRFYFVQPFIGRLRNWVSRRRRVLGLGPAPWEVTEETNSRAARNPNGVGSTSKNPREARNLLTKQGLRQHSASLGAFGELPGTLCTFPGIREGLQPPMLSDSGVLAHAAAVQAVQDRTPGPQDRTPGSYGLFDKTPGGLLQLDMTPSSLGFQDHTPSSYGVQGRMPGSYGVQETPGTQDRANGRDRALRHKPQQLNNWAPANLVLSSSFRFDMDAIMRTLTS